MSLTANKSISIYVLLRFSQANLFAQFIRNLQIIFTMTFCTKAPFKSIRRKCLFYDLKTSK